ncbi:MAG: putative ABC transporter permease [Clostridia bacterium]|nr:putative ABC transporter permease [Clostridia bacterium]
MNEFLKYLFLFFIGATSGWCIELVYRRFFSPAKKWINPGFLNGPYLPLYGFGVCIMYFICSFNLAFYYEMILFCVLMTLIEYVAGIIFINGMGIKLWDYSKRWLNYKGIICPLFSLFWTALGEVFSFFIYPYLQTAVSWLSNNLAFSFIVGLFYGVMLVDFGITLHLSAKIRQHAKKIKEIVAYERLKDYIHSEGVLHQEKRSFLFPFKSKLSIGDILTGFFNQRKEKNDEASRGKDITNKK